MVLYIMNIKTQKLFIQIIRTLTTSFEKIMWGEWGLESE